MRRKYLFPEYLQMQIFLLSDSNEKVKWSLANSLFILSHIYGM